MKIWKTAVIDGVKHPRYKVSSDGEILCLNWNNTGKEKICCLNDNGNGYLMACIDGKLKYVHRIVAETFIPNPEGKPCIDHINAVRNDNYVLLDADGQTVLSTNLRWCTHKENQNNPITRKRISKNCAKLTLGKFGSEHPKSISIVQLTLDGKYIRKWGATREVERELGINRSSICHCCQGKLKSAGGFRWVYLSDYIPIRHSLSEIKPLF